ITAEAEGKKSATTTVTITPGTIAKLVFVPPTAGTLTVGMPYAMNVQTRDKFDNPIPENATIIVHGDDQSRFSEASSDAAWTTSGTFTKTGTSSLTFFFKQNGTSTPVIITAAIEGTNISATYSVTILLLDNSSSGSIMADDGKTTVDIGTGAVTGAGSIEIDTSGTSTADIVIAGNAKDDADLKTNRVEGTLRKFEVHNATITTVRIFIPYPDSNPADGYVDGVTPQMPASSLAIYHLVGSGTAAIWEKVTSSRVDTINKVVYADVSSFSFYQLMGAGFVPNPDKAVIYPNPYYADRHSCIYFDHLTQDSTIQIFTIAGELVREIKTTNSRMEWDTCNSVGEKVASGTYICLIKDPSGNKKVGKFCILR
ncbi:MAG: T9SS type A sorting domain-containing protein, partial [Candidatus Desantisbacteria bacterium]